MTEQEATDKLERLVGSPQHAFKLMGLYGRARFTASGNEFTLRKMPTLDDVFIRMARDEGFSAAAISHYLKHVR